MSGRTKQKVYQYEYNTYGKFIKSYDSISEVRRIYFFKDSGKRPLLANNTSYKILSDNTIISKERIGREGVVNIIKRENNKYINLGNLIKPVKVYNLDNKLIAEFISPTLTSKIMNIPLPTLYHKLNNSKNAFDWEGLKFTY
jgi:hypothetical protein